MMWDFELCVNMREKNKFPDRTEFISEIKIIFGYKLQEENEI